MSSLEREKKKERAGCRPKKLHGENEGREESMMEHLIDAVYGVIIGHCVSLAQNRRKCDR